MDDVEANAFDKTVKKFSVHREIYEKIKKVE
jgi:hypothetical protein